MTGWARPALDLAARKDQRPDLRSVTTWRKALTELSGMGYAPLMPTDPLQEAFIAQAIKSVLTPQGWAVAWQEGLADLEEASVAWLRSRPEGIKDLMRRFPPSCLVRAHRSLGCPAPGTVGIVTSYSEDGTLSVRQSPDSPMRAQCAPEDLEVVGYWRGLTPQRLAALLDG